MLHLLTMRCTVTRDVYGPGVDSYNQPTKTPVDTEAVRCLYQTLNDVVVEEMAGRGVEATGRLFFMPSVTIDDGDHVSAISRGATVIEAGPLEVIKVRAETSPAGVHHLIATVKKAERCR